MKRHKKIQLKLASHPRKQNLRGRQRKKRFMRADIITLGTRWENGTTTDYE